MSFFTWCGRQTNQWHRNGARGLPFLTIWRLWTRKTNERRKSIARARLRLSIMWKLRAGYSVQNLPHSVVLVGIIINKNPNYRTRILNIEVINIGLYADNTKDTAKKKTAETVRVRLPDISYSGKWQAVHLRAICSRNSSECGIFQELYTFSFVLELTKLFHWHVQISCKLGAKTLRNEPYRLTLASNLTFGLCMAMSFSVRICSHLPFVRRNFYRVYSKQAPRPNLCRLVCRHWIFYTWT